MKKTLWLWLLLIAAIVSCKKEWSVSDENYRTMHLPQQDRGFIIMAKEGASISSITAALAALGSKRFVLRDTIAPLGLIHVQTPDPGFPEKARLVTGVEGVVVDLVSNWRLPVKTFRMEKKKATTEGFRVSGKTAPGTDNNPLSFLQWGLESVKARGAWQKGYQGRGAIVAVLDGGFLLNDPELMANVVATRNFIAGEEVQYRGSEGFSHGTHVAGTIAAVNDNIGVVGVAPEAKLILVKVLNDEGKGPWSSIINGIYYAACNKANVINMSLGAELPRRTFVDDNGTPDDPSDDLLIEYDRDVKDLVKALNRATFFATRKGITTVAAAGNDAYDYDREKRFITYPAACNGVLCISANGPLGWGFNQDTSLYVPSIFTNSGKNFVSYAGPGGNYALPVTTNLATVRFITAPEYVFDFVFNLGGYDAATGELSYMWAAGTSMAAPHVSAVAAMLYGKYGRYSSPSLIEHIFKKTSTDRGARGRDAFFGSGQIDATRAVSN